jgi:hypothetical protein
LATAVFTLGIPHPPGYPTYVLLGKLFTLIPVGTIAYRMNLFSAVSAATAVGFLATIISYQLSVVSYQSDRSLFTAYCSLSTSLSLAFAPLVWGQALITEVYSLNLAMVAIFLWALLGKRPSWFVGFLLGLSVTTHLTSWLMLPLALALTPCPKWWQLAVGLFVGLSPFLALPWLAQTGSPVAWGDPTTLAGWWWLVSGRLYNPNLFALPTAEWWPRLAEWLWQLGEQFTWAGLPLIVVSFFRPQRFLATEGCKPLRSQWMITLTAVSYFLYALGYNTPDAIVFFLPGL